MNKHADQGAGSESGTAGTVHFGGMRDPFFAIIFGANCIVVLALAMSYGIAAMNADEPTTVTVRSDGEQVDTTNDPDGGVWLGGFLFITAVSVVLTLGWLFLISKMSSQLIMCTLFSVIVFKVISGVVLFMVGSLIGGLFVLILAVVSLGYIFWIRDRISFAAVNMKTASKALQAMPSILVYAVAIMAGLVLWSLIWSLAVYGVATNEAATTVYSNGIGYGIDECATYKYSGSQIINGVSLTCSGETCRSCLCLPGSSTDAILIKNSTCIPSSVNPWIYFAMLLSLLWASSVFTNIVHCTTAGAVGSWWFNYCATPNSAVVYQSFVRSVTSSLGPICLGSLLVAVVGTCRAIVRYLISTSKASNQHCCSQSALITFLLSCLYSVLYYLDMAMKYFNRYAYSYISIYGHSFMQASRAVIKLFRSRGAAAIINDDLIDTVMRLGQTVVGIVSFMIAYWYGNTMGLDYASRTTLSLIGFVEGYVLCAVTLKVFSAAVSTIYVCYAEDPLAFEASHPDLYIPLHEAWMKLYPPLQAGVADDDDSDDDDMGGKRRSDEENKYVPPDLYAPAIIGQTAGWEYTQLPTAHAADDSDSISGGLSNTIGRAVFSAAVSNPAVASAVASSVVSAAASNPGLARAVATEVSSKVVKL